jgi:hypothetical protein
MKHKERRAGNYEHERTRGTTAGRQEKEYKAIAAIRDKRDNRSGGGRRSAIGIPRAGVRKFCSAID